MPSRSLESTPRADGFSMPAEWERHERCYLIWPERTDNWRLGAKPAQSTFLEVVEAIARSEPVTVLVSARQWEHARASCSDAVQVVEMATDDAWVRDTGPTFVVNRSVGERRGVDWVFNAWGGLDGGLYFPWAHDDLVAAKVCDLERAPRYRAPFVLEGGSIHVDGEGTCITTEECLLHPNRNPDLTRREIEALLVEYLGVEKVIWIPRGVHGDETDGHVDNLACFTRPGRVLLTWTEAPATRSRRSPGRPGRAGVGDRCPGTPVGCRPPARPGPAVDDAGRRPPGVDRSEYARPRIGGRPPWPART